jgi:hypothetical protein
MTESTKVQAQFESATGRVRAPIRGVIKTAPEGTLWIVDSGYDGSRNVLSFDPLLPAVRKYGDERSMEGRGEGPFGLRFRSILSFIFPDGSTLGILEIAGE